MSELQPRCQGTACVWCCNRGSKEHSPYCTHQSTWFLIKQIGFVGAVATVRMQSASVLQDFVKVLKDLLSGGYSADGV